MSGSSDVVDYFKLDATFDPIHAVTRENVRAADGTRRTVVKEWKRTKRLSNGAFGTVWLEEETEKRDLRAIKEVSKGTSTTARIDYTRELEALRCLSNYRDIFVSFHGWFECEHSIYFSMEYFKYGDLERFITPALTEQDARIIARQLLEGLQILHEKNWAHRDLKPQNILVVKKGPDWWVKIGDFGISKRIHGQQSPIKTIVGTFDYIAPEVSSQWFSGSGSGGDGEDSSSYTVAVDIWSLGCVLHRLLTRQVPFSSDYSRERYCSSQIPFPTEMLTGQLISQDCIELVLNMMKPEARERLTAAGALSHAWIVAAHSKVQTTRSTRGDSSEGPTSDTGEHQITRGEQTVKSSRTINNDVVDEVTIAGSTRVHTSLPKNHQLDQETGIDSHTAIPLAASRPAVLPLPFLSPEKINLPSVEIQGLAKEFLQRRHTLGEEHQETLQSIQGLALAYFSHQLYEEASQLFTRVFEARKRVLGAKHVDTLDSIFWLAVSCSYLKQCIDSQLWWEDVCKRELGAKHDDTFWSMHWLANSYFHLTRYDEARMWFERIVDAHELVPGTHSSISTASGTASASSGCGKATLTPDAGVDTDEKDRFKLLRNVIRAKALFESVPQEEGGKELTFTEGNGINFENLPHPKAPSDTRYFDPAEALSEFSSGVEGGEELSLKEGVDINLESLPPFPEYLLHQEAPPDPRKVNPARALYDFTPEDEDGLPFKEGDDIEIVEKNAELAADGWCKARVKGSMLVGLAPLDYLEELRTPPVSAAKSRQQQALGSGPSAYPNALLAHASGPSVSNSSTALVETREPQTILTSKDPYEVQRSGLISNSPQNYVALELRYQAVRDKLDRVLSTANFVTENEHLTTMLEDFLVDLELWAYDIEIEKRSLEVIEFDQVLLRNVRMIFDAIEGKLDFLQPPGPTGQLMLDRTISPENLKEALAELSLSLSTLAHPIKAVFEKRSGSGQYAERVT